MKYVVVYEQSMGSQMQMASMVPTIENALYVAATLKTQGFSVKGVFQQMRGKLEFTAKLVDDGSTPDLTHLEQSTPQVEVRAPMKRGKWAKRTPSELENLRMLVLSWVQTNPGESAETMAKSLRIPTKELVLPIRHLLSIKALKKRGQRRATKYYLGPRTNKPMSGIRTKSLQQFDL